MREKIEGEGNDLLIVDTGDRVEGNGLYDASHPKGLFTYDIFKEQDVIIRALRDYFTPDIDEVVVDSDEAYDRAADYMSLVMPGHKSALRRYVWHFFILRRSLGSTSYSG